MPGSPALETDAFPLHHSGGRYFEAERHYLHLHLHLGFVRPLQDVALHQCLPSLSVCCFPNPGGSLLLCYVILPSSILLGRPLDLFPLLGQRETLYKTKDSDSQNKHTTETKCLLLPATFQCISGTDLLRQLHVLPH